MKGRVCKGGSAFCIPFQASLFRPDNGDLEDEVAKGTSAGFATFCGIREVFNMGLAKVQEALKTVNDVL
jgi:hypothetical protein